MKQRALITGITGQDGSYLAEFLLSKNYEVHGILRRSSSFNTGRIDHIFDKLNLHHGDLLDPPSLLAVLKKTQPHEVYNLGAQSHVMVSFEVPAYTANVTAIGALNLLEAVRTCCPPAKFYQASSSEMYGNAGSRHLKQNEDTVFRPRSPYAFSKVFAHHAAVNYREAYGLHTCCGILFNHESPRRGETFVTRKITIAVAKIVLGLQREVVLGNLAAKRDWGFAGDYVKAMWQMLQHRVPDDYVIATGEAHTVQEFAAEAFNVVNLDWNKFVKINSSYLRPTEIDHLCGDPYKANRVLSWTPTVNFKSLIKIMVESDLKDQEKRFIKKLA